MFDIRFYVVRGAAYSLTLLALSLLYVGPVVYGLIVGLGYELRWEKFAVAVIVGSIAAFYYQNLRQRFDRFTAKIFFRDDYDSELFISQLNKAVVSNLDLNSMLVSAADIIKQNMKTEYCLFMIKHSATAEVRVLGGQEKDMHFRDIQTVGRQVSIMEEKIIVTDYIEDNQSKMKEALRNNNVAVVGRLSGRGIDEDLVQSYILLGPRKSGNLYNMRDIRILEAIIDGLTVAIQNALRFEEIQDFNTNLQRRIDEATRQLRRTNAKLQALDETKDDFISMASHQLRTPLTTIKGYISMVLDGDAGPLTPTQQKMLDQAFVSSQRMVFLIADLLNISRLKTGKFVIEPSKVDLAKVVDDEIRQLKETAAGRNLELVYDKPADFPDLMLDETKIRQVIMNFIDNAIYYTPSGGKITVKLIDSPGTVEFRVIDSGIGVPKSEQPHLFTKFYRAGNARRARPDGTGLGLFMAKKVIVAQGGLTIFESKEGKGSTFGFIFSKAKVGVQPEPKKIPVTA
ncbi:MAG TPA: HAMP domain-containing sensor histidine kinase [Candidatus Saccharimonadales bacterium]|nr:HAMP domain-containing sensor histidine kinase [Candidatus Saccharimonadales bacterium]